MELYKTEAHTLMNKAKRETGYNAPSEMPPQITAVSTRQISVFPPIVKM